MHPATRELTARLIEDSTGSNDTYPQFSVESAYDAQTALAGAYLDMGPDIAHLYKQPAEDPKFATAYLRRVAAGILRGDILQEPPNDASADKHARQAHLVHGVNGILLATIEELAQVMPDIAQGAIVSREQLSALLGQTQMSPEALFESPSLLNEEERVDSSQFSLGMSESSLNLALGQAGDEYMGPHFDRAVIVPTDLSHPDAMQRFKEANSYSQWLDVRGVDQGEYDVLRDGTKVDFRHLRMANIPQIPDRLPYVQYKTDDTKRLEAAREAEVKRIMRSQDIAMIIAAAHARASKAAEMGEKPSQTVRFLDSTTTQAEEADREGGRKQVKLHEAVKSGLPIMDLPTYLTLCLQPEFEHYLANRRYALVLNHVLPDGRIVTVGRNQGLFLFGTHKYEHVKDWDVFVAA